MIIVEWMAGADPIDTAGRLVQVLGGDRPGPLPKRWGLAQTNYAESLIDTGRWDEARATLDMVLAESLADWVFWGASDSTNISRCGAAAPRCAPTRPRPRRAASPWRTRASTTCLRPTSPTATSRPVLATLKSAAPCCVSLLGDDRISTNPWLPVPAAVGGRADRGRARDLGRGPIDRRGRLGRRADPTPAEGRTAQQPS